ncbi:MAG TPA: hypothetical protein VJS44_07205 [Pyrinomonadaceae bacterium]|nr:hypothetical protein [Pyrinomonadaceae bacterium]
MSANFYPRSIRIIGASFILFTVLATGTRVLPSRQQGPQQQEQIVPSFPTGAVAAFPNPVAPLADGRLPVDKIFIRQDPPANNTIWVVEPQEVMLGPVAQDNKAASPSAASSKGVGFVVPQLDKGNYEAWYESPSQNQPGQSMKLAVVPQLLVEEGLKRSAPGAEIEIRVKISSPKLFVKNSTTPQAVSVPVRIQSSDPSVADVAASQAANVVTDAEGYARWKIRVKRTGLAEFTASANNFEPASVYVVGMSMPAQTLAEAELREAEAQATAREAEAQEAATRVTTLVARAQEETQTAKSRVTEAEVTLQRMPEKAAGKDAAVGRVMERQKAVEAIAESAEARVADARESAVEAQQRAAEARAFARAKAAVVAQVSTIREADLKPGDAFLVKGGTPIVSPAIMAFESSQLGGSAPYSHASLYLGEINGIKMVAEMWSSGYWITPLSVSISGAIIVDVFRWPDITDGKREEIASKGSNMFGEPYRYIRSNNPAFFTSGSPVPYAYEEIGLLTMAVKPLTLGITLRTLAIVVDALAGGRRKMICSELVAWVYRDVGLELQMTYWPKLSDAGIFSTDDRRKDYTTPNMIARSSNLRLMGRLKGP